MTPTEPELSPAAAIIGAAIPLEPAKVGIYFLVQAEQIVYVGQSIDVDSRIRQHRRGHMQFDHWAWLECAPEVLDRLERAYIDAFMPRHNNDMETRNKRRASEPREPAPTITMPDLSQWPALDPDAITPHDISVEKMRRLREMKRDKALRWEDFGPMPVEGSPRGSTLASEP